MLRIASLLVVALALHGGVSGAAADPSAAQHHTIDELTSLFENSTPVLQYGYCENIGDGRGYTAGRAGFTTGTDDLLQVVELYTQREPNNPLAQFIPALQKVDGSGSTAGLQDLCNEWSICASQDAVFRATQDDVVNSMYWQPSLAHSHTLGLQLPISFGQMYDAIIQHGDGDDNEGLPYMISQATNAAGGSPASGVAETDWLNAFFAERIAVLEANAGWKDSVDRVYCYQRISNNPQLDLPMTVTAYGDTFTLTADTVQVNSSRPLHKLKMLTEQ